MWTLLAEVPVGGTVKADQRLPWLQTTGIGMQHVIAMFGATFLVPLLTGFPPTTTVFFSGVGTIIFLIVTRNKIPSYLGSSFAFIAPVIASMGADKNIGLALGGIVAAGLMLFLVGFLVNRIGHAWINVLMPPVVTGAIVMLIGLNLAPVAVKSASSNFAYSLLTIVAIVVIAATLNGFLGRISIFLGVVIAWIIAALTGGIDPKAIEALQNAAWFGWPEFHAPQFALQPFLLMIPVVIVLIAENTGHVKAVAEMTGESLDDNLGRAYMGDGLATMVAGFFGGSGTTTYAENIGVMAATRVYSTAAYFVAATFAIVLGMSPKFGALILTLPLSVLGGVTVILYGLIAVLGGRIWIEANVDFRRNHNLFPAAIAVIVGAGDLTWAINKELSFGGIALGTAGVLVIYHLMRKLSSEPNAEKRLAAAE
jgi:uracil-xanthine permease